MRSTALPATFNRLAWSNLAAQSAEQIGLAAAPIVAVLALGAGPGETGLLQAVQMLPFLLLSLPAGVLADRLPRRALMMRAETVRAGSLLAILALAAVNGLSLPVLALLGALGATGTVAYNVAAPSLVPALVPAGSLVEANRRMELARSIAFTAGPALAGALVSWTGAAPAFGFAAVLSIAAVVLLARVHEPPRPALPPRPVLHDLRQGAAFVLGHRLLRPVLLTAFFFNTSFFLLQAVYVPYAVGRLGLTASAIGWTLAAYGAGMLVAATLARRVAAIVPFGAVIAIGPVAGLAAGAAMLLTVWVPSAALAGASFFLIGAGPMLWVISTTTLRQAVTPEGQLGRVSAVITTATYGARPLGAAIGAGVGGWLGVEACLFAAAIGFLIQVAIILASPVPRLVRQPEMGAADQAPRRRGFAPPRPAPSPDA